MNDRRNILRFARLLVTRPTEFYDRAEVICAGGKEKLFRHSDPDPYPERIAFPEGLRALTGVLGRDLCEILREKEFQEVQSHITRVTLGLKSLATLPFPIIYNADPTLAPMAYALCRVLEPETVLETGVGYGVTSATILAALYKNGKGTLRSIDLPPIADRGSHVHIGMMIPAKYRDRWHLHLGSSKRVLPGLLAKNSGKVGLFIHDSANLYRVQKTEEKMVWPHMSSRAAMIINNTGKQGAFAEFVREEEIRSWYVVEQSEKKGDLTGIILKP